MRKWVSQVSRKANGLYIWCNGIYLCATEKFMYACDSLDLGKRAPTAVHKGQSVAARYWTRNTERKTFNRVMDNRDRAIPHIIIVIYFYLCASFSSLLLLLRLLMVLSVSNIMVYLCMRMYVIGYMVFWFLLWWHFELFFCVCRCCCVYAFLSQTTVILHWSLHTHYTAKLCFYSVVLFLLCVVSIWYVFFSLIYCCCCLCRRYCCRWLAMPLPLPMPFPMLLNMIIIIWAYIL